MSALYRDLACACDSHVVRKVGGSPYSLFPRMYVELGTGPGRIMLDV